MPHCLLPQQPVRVVAVPVRELLAQRHMGTVCVDVAGAAGWHVDWHLCHCWQWAGRASAMLCVYIHLPSVLLSPPWPLREKP